MNDDDLRRRFAAEPAFLPAPPGQLERVQRRSARRRTARLTGILATAAVAATSVAALGLGVLRDSGRSTLEPIDPPPVSVSPSPRPTPTISPSARPSSPAPVGQRVPPDPATAVQDLSWTSTTSGWALGLVLSCAGRTGDSAGPPCTTVSRTTDGGESWSVVATFPGSFFLPSIRFADSRTGYLILDERLLLTRDGGQSWVPLAVPGHPLAVEVAESGALVLTNAEKDAFCLPCSVYRSPLGGTTLRKVLEVNSGVRPQLARSHDLVYAAVYENEAGGADDKSAEFHRSADGGAAWTRVEDPCVSTNYPSRFGDNVVVAGRTVAVECSEEDGGGSVMVSADGGRTYGRAHASPCRRDTLAVGSATVLVCASDAGLHTSSDGGAGWRVTRPSNRQASPEDCGMQTESVGRCWLGTGIFHTHDGGHTWRDTTLGG